MVTGERPSRTAVSLRVCPCESPAPAKAASRRSESPNLSRMSIPARSATSPMPARRRRLRKGPARNLGADQQSTSLLLSISPSHYSGARPLLLDFFSLRPRPTRFFTPRIRDGYRKRLLPMERHGSSVCCYFSHRPAPWQSGGRTGDAPVAEHQSPDADNSLGPSHRRPLDCLFFSFTRHAQVLNGGRRVFCCRASRRNREACPGNRR